MEYVRKTKDVYYLMGNYGYGWEEMIEYDTYKQAKQDLISYRENVTKYGNGYFYIKKRRVKI